MDTVELSLEGPQLFSADLFFTKKNQQQQNKTNFVKLKVLQNFHLL
jgi:hypothetical protein